MEGVQDSPGGRGWGGAQLTWALQLMQGEARGGSPTETEVRRGEVMVYVQPDRLWGQGQRQGKGHGPQGRRQVRAWYRGGVWVPAAC